MKILLLSIIVLCFSNNSTFNTSSIIIDNDSLRVFVGQSTPYSENVETGILFSLNPYSIPEPVSIIKEPSREVSASMLWGGNFSSDPSAI